MAGFIVRRAESLQGVRRGGRRFNHNIMALDDDALRRLIKGAMKRSRTAELLSLETVELAKIDNLIRTELARRAEEALRYGGR